MMEKYTYNLEGLVQERTDQLAEQTKKTEALLHQMLPKLVACNMFYFGTLFTLMFGILIQICSRVVEAWKTRGSRKFRFSQHFILRYCRIYDSFCEQYAIAGI